MNFKNKWTPLIIALAIGLLAAAYYLLSGKGSYDLSVRNLSQSGKVEKVESSDAKTIKVKCKNGENYEIAFKEDQGSYADLVFDACGPERTQQ